MFSEQKHNTVVAVINQIGTSKCQRKYRFAEAYPKIKVLGSGASMMRLPASCKERGVIAAMWQRETRSVEREEITDDLATIEAGEALKPDVVVTSRRDSRNCARRQIADP